MKKRKKSGKKNEKVKKKRNALCFPTPFSCGMRAAAGL
jgi:hypothetical protein